MPGLSNWSTRKRIITGLIVLNTAMISSCAHYSSSQSPLAASPASITQAGIGYSPTASTADPQAISFEICSDLPHWQRPTLEEQRAELAANPRYGSSLDEEPLQSLFEQFWHESVFAFTTYGLSARMEPINLSGVWSAITEMEPCYGEEAIAAINAGQIAELWLIGYTIQTLDWSGDQYQVKMTPTSTGLQLVQFERIETNAHLPITATTPEGSAIAVMAGDW